MPWTKENTRQSKMSSSSSQLQTQQLLIYGPGERGHTGATSVHRPAHEQCLQVCSGLLGFSDFHEKLPFQIFPSLVLLHLHKAHFLQQNFNPMKSSQLCFLSLALTQTILHSASNMFFPRTKGGHVLCLLPVSVMPHLPQNKVLTLKIAHQTSMI